MDGLDEASDETKEALLEILPTLGSNILITSRPLPGLVFYVPDAMFLSIQALTEDIDRFVRSRIAKRPRLRALIKGNHDVINDICARVKEQSDGM